jgi:hypothetical protein
MPDSTQTKARRIARATGGGTTMHRQFVRNYDRKTGGFILRDAALCAAPQDEV